MGLESTQPVTEMSTRNIFLGVKAAGPLGWQTYHFHIPYVLKSGHFNLLEPPGPVQACIGIALPLPVESIFVALLVYLNAKYMWHKHWEQGFWRLYVAMVMTEILDIFRHLWLKYALCFLRLQVDQRKGKFYTCGPIIRSWYLSVKTNPAPETCFLNLNRWIVLNNCAMKMAVLNLIIHKTSRGAVWKNWGGLWG